MCLSRIIAPHLYPYTRIIYSRSKDSFNYRSKLRKCIVKQNDLSGRVENHHIIPKEFKKHELLQKLDFDINASHNICILPNRHFDKLYGRGLVLHDGGHRSYNKFVKNELDRMVHLNNDELKYNFWLFIMYLKNSLDTSNESMPWR